MKSQQFCIISKPHDLPLPVVNYPRTILIPKNILEIRKLPFYPNNTPPYTLLLDTLE